MILPVDLKRRARKYADVVDDCRVSIDERRTLHQQLRSWYLTGTDEMTDTSEGGPAAGGVRYNKIKSAVDGSSAYLFAPDAIRFELVLGPTFGEEWIEPTDAGRDEFERLWHDEGFGLPFGVAVKWGHVYPTTLLKVVVERGQAHLALVSDPANVGVLREDTDDWDSQEAICHWYGLALPSFIRLVARHPERARLIQAARQAAIPGETRAVGDATAVGPTTPIGIAGPTAGSMAVEPSPIAALARAQVREPVVPLAELWVWDDEIRDYRTATMIESTEELIADPANPLRVRGSHPFIPLTYEPTPGYLWGTSLVGDVIELQRWREEVMGKINDLLHKQLEPGLAFFGVSGIAEERARVLREAEGIYYGTVGGSVTPIYFQMPPEVFQVLEVIDRQFADQFGLPQLLQGQGEPGLRAGSQTQTLATLGSARILSRAMIVQRSLEDAATLLWRVHRLQAGDPILTESGKQLLLTEYPADGLIRVAAHSASPLYAEQTFQRALALHAQKAIDHEDLVELSNVPLRERLRIKARKLQKSQAEMGERVLEIQAAKAQRTGRR